MDVQCLPPELHNRPERIPAAVRDAIVKRASAMHRSSWRTPIAAPVACSTRCCRPKASSACRVRTATNFSRRPRVFAELSEAEARHVLPDRLPGASFRPTRRRRASASIVTRSWPVNIFAITAAWSTSCNRGTPTSPAAHARSRSSSGSSTKNDSRATVTSQRACRTCIGPRTSNHHGSKNRMASLIVISWRDVPAQVIVKRGREVAKVQLSQRFQEAVDRAAMRAGRGSSDAYLEDWKRAAPVPCGDDLQAEAESAAAAIEARYSDDDLLRIIRAKGIDETLPQPFVPAAAAGKRNCLMYAVRLWSVRHARGLSRIYAAFEAALLEGGSVAGAHRLPASRTARGGRRARGQGLAVRLPDVRPLRAEFDRHVVPDELSKAAAQRAVRRRARQRQLRGETRDALRLGRSLARRRAHSRRPRCDPEAAATGRSPPGGHLGLAARRA